MTSQFTAEVFQNKYLSEGAKLVNAIMTVTVSGEEETINDSASNNQRVFGIICDRSGSMGGDKIRAAKEAMTKIVNLLPEDAYFFIITGASTANLILPLSQATRDNKIKAFYAIKSVVAGGGTVISEWLSTALPEFLKQPNSIRQALLLTDGQNYEGDERDLYNILDRSEGVFQCECRGVGTDWEPKQLKIISDKLLGTTDIIPDANQIEADFQAILGQAMGKVQQDVSLRLWSPVGAKILFCKQVSPDIVDLTTRAKAIKPQILDYPTGAWGKNESRDYHFCIEIKPGNVGDEMLAGRASLVYTLNGVETIVAKSQILAIWTDDDGKSTKINKQVAHYTGQADLAQSIQEGLEARNQGNLEIATAKLGKAVKLAHESGNESTAKLLRNVVDILDAPTGTVRLKRTVEKADEMMLETRSTKTTRIQKSNG
jgi:hypothetical protein